MTEPLFADPPTPPAPRVPIKLTAAAVKDALRRRHPSAEGAWVCVEEAFSGYANWCGGIDLLAVGVWRTAKAPGLPGAGRGPRRRGDDVIDARNAIVAYEVKVSRSDFRRELYGYKPGPNVRWRTRSVPPWPGKAHDALAMSHYFMFATPRGLLHDDEIERREPWDGDEPRRGALYLPAGVGLVEVDGRGCHVRHPAELRAPRPWTRHETAELLRRASYLATRRAA